MPPRDKTPKLTHLPPSKAFCSKAFDPESPSHVAFPDRNSAAVICDALDGRQSVKFLSLGMQVRLMSCLMRRIPAVVPAVSVGELKP